MNTIAEFTQVFYNFLDDANATVLSPIVFISILGVGALLTVRLSFLPLRKLGYGFRLLWRGRTPEGDGDISAFSALMTSLSATVGVGNIVGVATAIALGGPGALFWMWMCAFVGMATKFSEAVLAVHFRETDSSNKHIGGPMYYISKGLGEKWVWLAGVFSMFGAIAAFGIGNMTQSNAIADALDGMGIAPIWTALVLMFLVGSVLLGGITRIAAWATLLVPFLAVSYFVLGLIVLAVNAAELPSAFHQIFVSAFTGTAATGGFAGAAVWAAIRFGIARGVASNEAGLGSASIAHAAATTTDPVRQGTIAMLGTFIDTIVICSITGLAIVSTGVWKSGATGVGLTTSAFETAFPFAEQIIAVAIIIFGFTTILGWSYYGEKCWQYLFGLERVKIYRTMFILAIAVGPLALTIGDDARVGINLVWLISEALNAMMAAPNLIALVLLSPVVMQLTRRYFQKTDTNQADTSPKD